MSSLVQPDSHGPARQGVAVPLTRGQRFLTTRTWWVLKNLIGWVLILLACVAVPLVPGPVGLPLFLIGFALISFPGKRRLTARVLRGRPVRFHPVPFLLACTGAALVLPVIALIVTRHRPRWLAHARGVVFSRGWVPVVALYLIMAAVAWVLARLTPHVLNVLMRITARARRTFRPWLRRHRIRLLPPRWRRRRPSEPGGGPYRLKDEILKFTRSWRPKIPR